MCCSASRMGSPGTAGTAMREGGRTQPTLEAGSPVLNDMRGSSFIGGSTFWELGWMFLLLSGLVVVLRFVCEATAVDIVVVVVNFVLGLTTCLVVDLTADLGVAGGALDGLFLTGPDFENLEAN